MINNKCYTTPIVYQLLYYTSVQTVHSFILFSQLTETQEAHEHKHEETVQPPPWITGQKIVHTVSFPLTGRFSIVCETFRDRLDAVSIAVSVTVVLFE